MDISSLLLLIIVFGCVFVGMLLKFALECISNNGHDGRGPIGVMVIVALVVAPLLVFYESYKEAQGEQEVDVLIAALVVDLFFAISLWIISISVEGVNPKLVLWGMLITMVVFVVCVWMLMKSNGGAFLLELLTDLKLLSVD